MDTPADSAGTQKHEITVDQLRVGDVLTGSGVTVTQAPTAGARTPAGKVDLRIRPRHARGDKRAMWGARTRVRVQHPRPPVVYRNGPIATRDVAGEWDRRAEEGE